LIGGWLNAQSLDIAMKKEGVKEGAIQYAIRRVFRIFPAYYFMVFFNHFLHGPTHFGVCNAERFIHNIFFVQNYFMYPDQY